MTTPIAKGMSILAAAMEITFGWCGGEISDQLEADEEEKRREGGRGLLGRRVQLTQSPLSLSICSQKIIGKKRTYSNFIISVGVSFYHFTFCVNDEILKI